MATLPQMKSFLTRASKKSDASQGLKNIANALKNFRQLEKEDQKDLNELVRNAYAKLKSKPKATTTKKKTTSKKTDSFTTELEKFKKKVGKIVFRRATSKTDIVKDAKRPALKSGKRIVRKKGYTSNQYGTFPNQVGTAYWESRSNRMDVNQPSQRARIKLAKGGEVDAIYKIVQDTNGIYEEGFYMVVDEKNKEILDIFQFKSEAQGYLKAIKEKGEKNVDSSQFNGQIHEYGRGGKLNSRANYIPNRNIEEVEVSQKGKTRFIDGADIFDGIYVKKKGSTFAKGGKVGNSYTASGENYSYTNTFGVDQDDFIKLVDVYHNTNPEEQFDRIVERLTYREFASKYGDRKLHDVMNYIHQTHSIHEKYAKGGKVETFPFLKFEDGQEAIKKVKNGELPKHFSYVEKEKMLYYLPNVDGKWIKLKSFETKKDCIEWVKSNLIQEGFAKGGKVGKYSKIDLIVKKPYGDEEMEVAKFKGKGDALISASALNQNSPINYNYVVKDSNKFVKGGELEEKFFAVTKIKLQPIKSVSFWKNRISTQEPTRENILEFLKNVPTDESICIYISDIEQLDGKLHSAYTPLYTNGAESVKQIVDSEGNVIWNLYQKNTFAKGGELDEAKIYVADLSEYNNGRLVGKWLNLSDYSSGAEVMEAIQEMLDEQTKKDKYGDVHEEYAIHDFEGFPRSFYHESMGESDFDALYDMMRIADSSNLPLDVLMEAVSDLGYEDDPERVAEAYFTSVPASMGNEFRDFAYEYIDSIGSIKEAVGNPEYYFDFENFGSDTRMDYSEEELEEYGYNDLSDEELGERMADELGGVNNLSEKLIETYFDYDKFGGELEYDFISVRGKDGNYYFFNRNFAKGGEVSQKVFEAKDDGVLGIFSGSDAYSIQVSKGDTFVTYGDQDDSNWWYVKKIDKKPSAMSLNNDFDYTKSKSRIKVNWDDLILTFPKGDNVIYAKMQEIHAKGGEVSQEEIIDKIQYFRNGIPPKGHKYALRFKGKIYSSNDTGEIVEKVMRDLKKNKMAKGGEVEVTEAEKRNAIKGTQKLKF